MNEARSEPAGVAVVIPSYNAAHTLAATLASVIDQPGVAEIVAIDDGSSDDTLAILRRHEPAIRVETGPNAGVSAARNRGIAATTAPWLLFLDADDLLLPGTVAARLALAEDDERDVIVCPWREMVDGHPPGASDAALRQVDWALLAEDAELACATRVWATTAAILYPRRLIDRIGGFRTDLPVIQDARLLFDAAVHGARFRRLDAVGAVYRVVPGSLSRRDPVPFWLDVLRNGEQIEQIWRGRGGLTQSQCAALAEIFDGATNALLRLGHSAAKQARAARSRYCANEPVKLRAGFTLLALCGAGAVRAVFRSGLRFNQMRRTAFG